MNKLLEKIELGILLIVVFLTPLVILPTSPNIFIVPKLTLLFTGVCLLVFIKALRIIQTGKIEYYASVFDLPLFLLIASFAVSTIFKTPNLYEALILPGTTTAVVSCIILSILLNSHSDKKGLLSFGLAFSGVLYSFLIFFSVLGLSSKPGLMAIIPPVNTTPEGGYFSAFIFLASLLFLVAGLVQAEKNLLYKVFACLCGLIIASGTLYSLYSILPGKPTSPKMPPLSTSWSIAVDSLKESPLLGIGPGNYVTAFNRFRPLSYNQTDTWNVRFATSSNFYLTLLTENGIVGLGAFGLLLFIIFQQIVKGIKNNILEESPLRAFSFIALTLLLLVLLIFPATLVTIFVLFILVSFSIRSHKTGIDLSPKSESGAISRAPAVILALPLILISIYAVYKGANIVYAEYEFKKGVTALSQNDAQGTYTRINHAITLNPYVDRYRITAAQVDLLLANSLISKSQGKDISEEDRKTITVLIQESIGQAKASVSLNPYRANNWEVLASIYQTIIPIAKGSDQFMVSSFQNAVSLDPFNPALRVALGGAYYQMKDYDNAVKILETAVLSKNDYANAYYNLAFAYREKGELEKAISAMGQVLALVDKNSKDFQVAEKALADMQSKQKEKVKENPQGEKLQAPQTETKPAIDPKVNLPEDAKPPETPVSPTPAGVSVTPVPSPTPNQ